MRRVVLAAALLVSACWTGAEPAVVEPAATSKPVPPRDAMRLRVKLERTGCLGTCPAYSVAISGDGRIEWVGHSNVIAIGRRHGRVMRTELEELARRLDVAQFFDRSEYGELPAKPECTTVAGTTSCSFSASVSICTDTSHAIITASRGLRTHTVDNDHCNERPELEALEDYIDRIANTDTWIGQ
jgi:hypothetical protein